MTVGVCLGRTRTRTEYSGPSFEDIAKKFDTHEKHSKRANKTSAGRVFPFVNKSLI